VPIALSRQYAALCAIEDFADPELRAVIAELVPGWTADEPHRKAWEFAMGALFLRDAGVLHDDAAVLDVGAGTEPILYWLANRCGRVVATDIYGRGRFASREAPDDMPADPAAFAPYEYRADRLEVARMDARTLEYPDATFDAVVSFSSIEHVGGRGDIQRAASQVGRVLKPGGVAFIVTELFLATSLLDGALVQSALRAATLGRVCTGATPRRRVVGEAFTRRTLQRDVIAPSGLALLQPLDTAVSGRWRDNVQTLHRDGSVTAPHGAYPHVAVRALRSAWTSFCLPLHKPRP
jgi:SAM-dependent methyltransferase